MAANNEEREKYIARILGNKKKWYFVCDEDGLYHGIDPVAYLSKAEATVNWLPEKKEWHGYPVFQWESRRHYVRGGRRVFECVPFQLTLPLYADCWYCSRLVPVKEVVPGVATVELGHYNEGSNNIGDCNTGDCNIGDDNVGDKNAGCGNAGCRNAGNWNRGSCNTGDSNVGDKNSGRGNKGDCNTDDDNTGSFNTGERNEGSHNAGRWNKGSYNVGEHNRGSRNVGDCNEGDLNVGSHNTGSRNIGNYNNGSGNVGDYNTGKDHVGYLNIGIGPLMVFNKPCSRKAWTAAKKPTRLLELISDTFGDVLWRWRNAYAQIPVSEWKLLVNLPNFDPKVFQKISGLLLDPKTGREVVAGEEKKERKTNKCHSRKS